MKVVVNRCIGGFSLSKKAYGYLGKEWDGCGDLFEDYEERNNPTLVKVVEELGKEADGKHAKLKVVEVPDNIEWKITDSNGFEVVEEVHRTWS